VAGVFAARVIEELAKVVIFSRRTRRVRWDVVGAASSPVSGRTARPVAREVDELEQLA
jgi:hypothetical protein